MAATPQVTGPCEVQVNTGAAGILASLGWTANGVEPRRTRLTVNIPGDQNGGDDGVPIEIQDLGGFYRVHLEMTKWDPVVAANIRMMANQLTATGSTNPFSATNLSLGTIPAPGSLIIANLAYYRLLLKPLAPLNIATNFNINFLCAIPIDDPYSLMMSSKYATLILDFICYPLAGVIWNQTTT